MKMKHATLLAAASISALAATSASAQTSGPVVVSATVIKSCILLTSNLDFGNYSADAAKTANATLSLTCFGTTSADISLDNGLNPTSGGQRQLVLGANRLAYDVFQPVSGTSGAACAYTTAWGSGANKLAVTGVSSSLVAPSTFSVCGRVPAGQNVTTGVYADTITASVTF